MLDGIFDIAIVGGGVIGCTTLFHLTNKGYRCILLEKNKDLISGASAGNSGMLHTGFDAPLGSLELHCIQQSQKQIFDLLSKLDLPCNRIGATMIAWNQLQLNKLPDILDHSRKALIADVRELSLTELYQREKNLAFGATGALDIPGEAIVDPWLTPIVLAEHARNRGAKICTDTLASNFDFDQTTGVWTVTTEKGQIKSHLVINCCGLYGDVVEKLAGYSSFKIKPRKGQYLIFDKASEGVISSNILPVPSETTKGVLIFKSVYNNVVIGPTAENTDNRSATPPIDDVITKKLQKYGEKTVPHLISQNIVRIYTGTRPATENKDYQILTRVDRNWLTVGGIRSTGLSACIGIAEHVYSLIKDKYGLEASITSWNTIKKMNFGFTNCGTVKFHDGIEHKITHPLTFTGIAGQYSPNSSL